MVLGYILPPPPTFQTCPLDKRGVDARIEINVGQNANVNIRQHDFKYDNFYLITL